MSNYRLMAAGSKLSASRRNIDGDQSGIPPPRNWAGDQFAQMSGEVLLPSVHSRRASNYFELTIATFQLHVWLRAERLAQ